jgi:hypothetical protein
VEPFHALAEADAQPSHQSGKSRQDLLFLAAQVVESGQQRVVKLAVKVEC